MAANNGFEKFGSILQAKKTKKPPAYQWQDFALRVIKELGAPADKKSSVFKVCKQFPKPFVEKCLNDTKELCQTGERWKYFFKLISKKM